MFPGVNGKVCLKLFNINNPNYNPDAGRSRNHGCVSGSGRQIRILEKKTWYTDPVLALDVIS